MAKFEIGDALSIKVIVVEPDKEDGSCVVTSDQSDPFRVWGCEVIDHMPMTLAQKLAGLSVERIEAALSRTDTVLADALEMAGAKIAKTRRESGEMRRKVSPKETAAVPVPAVEAAGEAHAAQPADDTPASEPPDLEVTAYDPDLEVTAYDLAKLAATRGGKSLDKYLKELSEDSREEVREFMPELLGIASAADHAAGENMPF